MFELFLNCRQHQSEDSLVPLSSFGGTLHGHHQKNHDSLDDAASVGAERWYIARGLAPIGPLTRAELQAQAQSGELKPGERVWTAEFPEWVEAERIKFLFPLNGDATAPFRVVSDSLPLMILGGVVLCFLVYFGRSGPAPSLAAKALSEAAAETTPPLALEASGDDTYAVEICNSTRESRLYAAVAYYDPLAHEWMTRGWFAEDQGACQIAIKNVRAPIYVYAETRDGEARWSDETRGREFCMAARGAFAVAQSKCDELQATGLRRQKFKVLRVNGRGGTHTWDLTE